MAMTIEQAAAALDGIQYGDDDKAKYRAVFADMRAARLVAAFGYSDDLVEFRGAYSDEEGASGSDGVHLFDSGGLVKSKCEEGEDCPYFRQMLKDKRAAMVELETEWDLPDRPAIWTYVVRGTPSATFIMLEGDDPDEKPYCQGVVFALPPLPQE